MNEYREWAKSKGLCIYCYKEKAWNGTTMCAECLAKSQENSEKTRSQASKEQRKKYLKRKRELCVAFGICRECLKREARVGKKCVECHVKEVKRNNSKRTQVPRNIRVELGLCYICGEKVLEGKKLCSRCYKNAATNISKRNKDNSNHIWRSYTRVEIEEMKSNFRKQV